MRLFLTGNPGVGKTTLVRAVLERLQGVSCSGFYTEEKRHRGQRVGFTIVTLNGEKGTLASLGTRPPTVGRYAVHLDAFEKLALPQLDWHGAPADLYVIDEIGKMELFSSKFKRTIIDLLAQPTQLLATIAKKGNGFIKQIKSRSDIELVEVTRANRDQLPHDIIQRITKAP
jgi:nucleoside-triphosphatase